jgi:hypothetical protein
MGRMRSDEQVRAALATGLKRFGNHDWYRELAADVYTAAFADNNDGIGIMSRLGVVRFVGKKQLKKARRYVRLQLAPEGIEYAIHFRFATHGDVSLANTHPFVLPDGKSYMMHNGVISWCGYDAVRSDTGVFSDLLDDYPGQANEAYLKQLGNIIGYGNKLCIMNADGTFSLVNDDAGLWDNGIWYSNTYSLPARLDAWRGKTFAYTTTGRSNVLPFTRTQTWLDKYDDSAAARELDWRKDYRLAIDRDDDALPSNLHSGCGLPIPTGYRNGPIRSQADYYASIEAEQSDNDALAELELDTDIALDGYPTDEELEQMELDDALLAMRRAGGA